MGINNIVLVVTCCFSGISIVVSILDLVLTKKISKNNGYINTITASRSRWADSIQNNGASYLALVDTIFFEKNILKKYKKLLKYQYAIAISLYNYEDDNRVKNDMQTIQYIVSKYIGLKNQKFLDKDIKTIETLKNDIFVILNKKHEWEWKKQKKEVS
jgi:hypothetical protein